MLLQHLAAGVVLAVPPVQIGGAAVVVGVYQLVRQRVVDFLLRRHMIAADHHLRAKGSTQLTNSQVLPWTEQVLSSKSDIHLRNLGIQTERCPN